MEQVVENARQLYEIRNDITNIIKRIEKKEINLDWLHRPESELINLLDKSNFEDLKKEPALINAVKNLKEFLKDMIGGEIDNIKDAQEEYLKKVIKYKNRLQKINRHAGSKNDRMYRLINDLEYIIFGVFTKKESDEKQPDIPELKESDKQPNILQLKESDKQSKYSRISEESAAQRQQGQGSKIITPKQMIIRLTILLAQLKAGNNSEKLKNEIRQIVYSLYRSKTLSKTIFNNLIDTI